jgi:hypothetical protein
MSPFFFYKNWSLLAIAAANNRISQKNIPLWLATMKW